MALNLRDRLYLQIDINGIELPLDKLNLLSYLHIVESVRTYVPMLSMRLTDATKFLTQNQLLTDGAVISITIGVDSTRKIYEFRLFGSGDRPSEGGTDYLISGYLNAPKYWIDSTAKAINGTASEVIQTIANRCDLSYEGVSTNESQIWLPHNTRYCEFSRQVSERAWIDEQSCIQLAVLANKTARLINVSDFDRQVIEFFSNRGGSNSMLPVTDYNVLSKAGFFNTASGYKQAKIIQSLVNPVDTTLDQLNVKRNSIKMSMSKDVKDSIEQSSVNYAPLDVGNINPTYEKALYQNRRVSNLFNFGVEFITPRMVRSNVLDLIGCEFSKPGMSGIQAISGTFLMTTKVTYIEGTNFFQKCEVYRHGINTDKETTQV